MFFSSEAKKSTFYGFIKVKGLISANNLFVQDYLARKISRRKLGQPVGIPGAIDRSHEKPNLAMSPATGSVPFHLSTPGITTPRVRKGFSDLKTVGYAISADESFPQKRCQRNPQHQA